MEQGERMKSLANVSNELVILETDSYQLLKVY